MHWLILLCGIIMIVFIVLIFLSMDWTNEIQRIKHHSKKPLNDLTYDVCDIYSGGILSMTELFRGTSLVSESD